MRSNPDRARNFLLGSSESRKEAKHGEKTGEAHGATRYANAARCVARRHAGGGEVWRLDDAARVGQTDALRRNQHFGAIAAPAQEEGGGHGAGKRVGSGG